MKKKNGLAKFLRQYFAMVLCATMLLGQAGVFLPADVFLAAEADEDGFVIEDGVLVDYVGSETAVVIPEGVTEIDTYAFKGNMRIVSVTIPEGVTEIKARSFDYCQSLEWVNLPESLERIGEWAFKDCALNYIEIPDNVDYIAENAFGDIDEYTDFTIIGAIGTYAETYAIENEYWFNVFNVQFSTGYPVEFSSKQVEVFTAIGDLPEATREFYRLVGWFTEDDVQVTEDTIITGNCMLEAKWENALVDVAELNIQLIGNGDAGNRFVYTGEEIRPYFSIRYGEHSLTKDVDYTLTYENNVEIGTATATIEGIGNYTGSIVIEFYIFEELCNIDDSYVVLAQYDYVYDGTAKTPEVMVLYEGTILEENVHYMVSYADNVEVGTALVEVTGLGKYTGVALAAFYIDASAEPDPTKINIADADIYYVWEDEYEYHGGPLFPMVSILFKDGDEYLIERRDYRLTYYNNIYPGTGTIVATGIGDYTGRLTFTFEIVDPTAPVLNGLVQDEDGNWYYYVDGKIATYYTGLVEHYGAWFYVENGILNWNYTGLTLYNGIWFYVNGGQLDWSYTGLVQHYGAWFYVEGGQLNWNYTGLVQYYDAWFYVEGGQLNWNYTGLVQYNGIWFYVNGGQLDWGYTGLVEHYGAWFYVEGGSLNWNYTGLVLYNGIWFYVNGGQLDWGYTGLVEYCGAWFYVEGGSLNWNYTGLVEYCGAWFYVNGGQLDWSYTGLCEYNGIWFYIQGGQLNWGYTGNVYFNGVWWYVENGIVVRAV